MLSFKLNTDLSAGISGETIRGVIEYFVSKQRSTSRTLFSALGLRYAARRSPLIASAGTRNPLN